MKTIMLCAMCLLLVSLPAQNYNFTHGTLNAGGGYQTNTLYSNTTAFGEYVVEEISTADYTGYLGFLFPILDQRPPVITSIDDVPNDQGREVQIVWNKCAFDDVYAIDTYYSVWRLDENFDVLKHSRKKQKLGQLVENVFTVPWKVIEQAHKDLDQIYYWQRDSEVWTYIDTIPALQYEEYALIAPTLVDSNIVDKNYSTFQVVYHDQFEYYESSPDSCYSIDNIAPDDTEVFITQNGTDMNLGWDEVEYGTFQGNSYPEVNGIWYKVYAGDSPDFICDEARLIDTVTNLNYNFPIAGEEKKFFKVVVSDQP